MVSNFEIRGLIITWYGGGVNIGVLEPYHIKSNWKVPDVCFSTGLKGCLNQYIKVRTQFSSFRKLLFKLVLMRDISDLWKKIGKYIFKKIEMAILMKRALLWVCYVILYLHLFWRKNSNALSHGGLLIDYTNWKQGPSLAIDSV